MPENVKDGLDGTRGATYIYEVDHDRDQFNAWLRGEFGDVVVDNPELEASVWSPTADPDGDGLINLAEAYHGLNPTAVDGYLALSGSRIEGNTFTLHWRRGKQTGGILADLEWSRDLQRWFGLGERDAPPTTERIAAEVDDHMIVQARVEIEEANAFFRLRYRRQ